MGAACSRETKKKNKYIVTKDTGVRKSETVHHNLGSENSNPQIQVPRRRSSAVQKLVKQSSVFRTRTAALSQALTTSTESIHKVYHIEPNPIGNGHFGHIRLANSLKDPRKVFAVKSIPKKKLENQSTCTIPMQEIEILKNIDHPNIIKFYETYQDGECYHIVMEYCSGGDLLDRLEKKVYTEDETRAILRMVLSAIKHLHEKGIAHRDIKLENFLFADKSPDSEIKLIDFGLSKRFNPKTPAKLTSFVGTVFYIAPEVIKGDYSELCDEWSIGVMMYTLLSGKPPFTGRSDSEIFQNIVIGYFELQDSFWGKLSPPARDLLFRLLTYDHTKRITASQALEHPWFTEQSSVDKDAESIKRLKSTHSDVVQNIRTFESRNKFRKEVLRIMVTLLSDEETKKLREAFRIFDINNTGEVTVEELHQVMNELGHDCSNEDIKRIVREISHSESDHSIKYTDFLAAAADTKGLTKDKLELMFKYFDVDDSKYITSDNIKEMMARAGRKMEDKEIKDMIKDVDILGDGRVNFDEFCAMMNVGVPKKSGNDEPNNDVLGIPKSLDRVPVEKEGAINVYTNNFALKKEF